MSVVAAAVVGSTVVGAVVAKDAAGRAASAQGDAANAQLAQQSADRRLALQYAETTPEELAQLNKAISLNEADIQRKQKLLDSSDPALIEAGGQALRLLRGEEAKTLGPLKNNIARQEQALRAKLQAQLGPGYENTTAGIQALQAFNQQANDAVSTAQQNTLGQLLGVAQNTSASYGMQNNISNAGTLGKLFGGLNERKISAINGTPISQGIQFAGDVTAARGQQQIGSSIIQTGGTLAGLYAGGAFSKAPPTASSTVASPTSFGGGLGVDTSMGYGK